MHPTVKTLKNRGHDQHIIDKSRGTKLIRGVSLVTDVKVWLASQRGLCISKEKGEESKKKLWIQDNNLSKENIILFLNRNNVNAREKE